MLKTYRLKRRRQACKEKSRGRKISIVGTNLELLQQEIEVSPQKDKGRLAAIWLALALPVLETLSSNWLLLRGRPGLTWMEIICFLFSSLIVAQPAAAAKSLQSCPTLCDPTDGSPPGSPSLGFSRQEHWSGLPFPSPIHESEKWKWSRSVGRVWLFATPWTAADQAPPFMGFSRQGSGVPLPSPCSP